MSDDDDIAAAEYVIGSLAGEERAQFVQRLAEDSELSARVSFWQRRLAPLDSGLAPATPPNDAWKKIAVEAFGTATAGVVGIASGGSGAAITELRRRIVRWRAATAGVAALAASLAGVIVFDRVLSPPPPPAGRYMAVVDAGGREPALVAEVDTRAGVIQVRSLAAETPSGHSLELWHIPDGEKPRSLGIIQVADRSTTIRDAVASGPMGGVIAVTVEPEGGSPTGDPTTAPIYSGRLIPLE